MARKGIGGVLALARRVGVHRNTIGRFIWKRQQVLPDSVSRILDELDLEPAEALERIREPVCDISAERALAETVDDLIEYYPRAAYVLFGLRARDRARRYSDFDLGVFSRDGVDLDRYVGLLDIKERHEDDLPWFIDLVNLNNADESFLGGIASDLRFVGGRQGDWQALLARCYGDNPKTS